MRLCSGQVKICQISSVSFERTSRFLSKFFIPLQFHGRLLLCTFVAFSSNSIYFAQKEPIKAKIFETFECTGQNLSNSLCQFLNNKSSPLQILYPHFVIPQVMHSVFSVLPCAHVTCMGYFLI